MLPGSDMVVPDIYSWNVVTNMIPALDDMAIPDQLAVCGNAVTMLEVLTFAGVIQV